MVPVSSILFCVITLLICLVLPIAVLVILSVKNKNQGIAPAWLLGAAGFFVTQILIRLPILTALEGQLKPLRRLIMDCPYVIFVRNLLLQKSETLDTPDGSLWQS